MRVSLSLSLSLYDRMHSHSFEAIDLKPSQVDGEFLGTGLRGVGPPRGGQGAAWGVKNCFRAAKHQFD